jgi:glycosyltransferase involved in cell wall biosynthesis
MGERIRVLSMLNKLYRGGHENRLLTMARLINKSEFDHRVMTVTSDSLRNEEEQKAAGSLRPEFAEHGILVTDFGIPESNSPSNGMTRSWRAAMNLRRTVRRLVKYIREHQIDVIDAHHTTAMIAARAASAITGVPLFHSSYHIAPWTRRFMTLPGKVTLGGADAIVTDSHFRAEEIKQWLGSTAPQLHVIPTGLETPQATRSASEVRQLLDLPLDPSLRIVGQISGLVEFKGHETLLESAVDVLNREPNSLFLCVGFSRGFIEYEQRLHARIAELGLSDRFLIRSYPGSIGDVWQLFDVFAHPSRFDSLPLVVVEAMAVGVPSVVTNVGGIPEVIRHENSGIVVNIDDVEAMANGIVRQLRDPANADRMKKNARHYYEQNLTPHAMTSALQDVYRSLAEARHESSINRAA